MSYLQTPFTLGSQVLSCNVFCAPLAGCSDLPFRKMTAAYNPGLICCEMVKMDALVRSDPGTFRMLDFEAGMHPIAAQLCGSKPELAGPCARILEDLGFDVIDLNCGCPVDKVTKDGSGSALLNNPEKVGEILANMVAAVKVPVTVKIRAGWDSESICAPQITEIAEKAGASSICIHGRTRAQGYVGPAKWGYIKACKQVAKNIKVIANGDIIDPLSAEKVFTETGCDGILLARGTMGQPWLIEDIKTYLQTGSFKQRTSRDYQEALLTHISYILSYQNDKRALLDIRRIGSWYLRSCRGAKLLREAVNRSRSLEEALTHIKGFSWEAVEVCRQEEPQEEDSTACSCV